MDKPKIAKKMKINVNQNDIDRLLEEVDNATFDFLKSITLTFADNPEWENARRTHDWRNHVPYQIKEIWSSLSKETKIIVHLITSIQANNEEWE